MTDEWLPALEVTAPARGDRRRLHDWEGATPAQLAAVWGVPAVHLYATLDSTSDVARELAEQGAASGTLVIAEEQKAGRGRVGRGWSSPPGLGLWMSVVQRPLLPSDTLPLRVAVAVADAVDAQLPAAQVQIKWPNDMMIGGKKIGGILCEAAWSGRELGFIIVGIGLNLLHSEADFPDELRGSATSLRIAAGDAVSRFAIAGGIVERLRGVVDRPLAGELHERLAQRDFLRGARVQLLEPESGRLLCSGRAAGISEEGMLMIDTADGGREAIRSGTVRVVQ